MRFDDLSYSFFFHNTNEMLSVDSLSTFFQSLTGRLKKFCKQLKTEYEQNRYG